MNVPFYSLRAVHQPLKKEFINAFSRIVDEGSFILGKDVEQFESRFAQFCNSAFAIGVGHGLDALKISLKSLDIGAGDEVVVPAHTYIATWLAVSEVGAIPVAVDVCEDTMTINPNLILSKITSKTKAIIPVHIYGLPCNMDVILEIARSNSLFVIEDFAQAQGATYKGKRVGSFGQINACSFYPSKNIGAMGDAGALTTSEFHLFKKAQMIRNYGSSEKYVHEIEGVNSRLDSIQAAILDIKLKFLENQNDERRKISSIYLENLKKLNEIKFQSIPDDYQSVYHLFTIRTNNRDQLHQFLKEKGVATLIHYPIPPHLQIAYNHLNLKEGNFPVAEKIAKETLSLPLFNGITNDEVNYVCQMIASYFHQK